MAGMLRRRVDFPFYQATSDNNIWSILGGKKDDFYIYDRCGRLTYHIGLPKSSLHYPIVQQAIFSTYYDSPCGECPDDSAVDALAMHPRSRERNRTPDRPRLRHHHPIDITGKVEEDSLTGPDENQAVGLQRR